MARWPRGEAEIERLLGLGHLQLITGAAADGAPLLAKASRTLATAASITSTDPDSALVLAYDAARYAATALLARRWPSDKAYGSSSPSRRPPKLRIERPRFERVPVPVQERLLRRGRIRPVDGLARTGQPQREQEHLGLHPGRHDPQIREVDLGFAGRGVGQRHEHVRQLLAGLGGDPRPGVADVVADRRVGDHQPVLLDQAFPDPAGRVPLLTWRRQVLAQHRVDHRLHRVQHRRGPLGHLPWRWLRRGQRLPNRAAMHPHAVSPTPGSTPRDHPDDPYG